MGIAVGGPSGLVVPVIRDADQTWLHAGIEKRHQLTLASRARDGAVEAGRADRWHVQYHQRRDLWVVDVHPDPESRRSPRILGMHKIQERPMAVAGRVEIRPMMYLALSYDHRIVDGKEAVSFLVRVKEGVEDGGCCWICNGLAPHIGSGWCVVRDSFKNRRQDRKRVGARRCPTALHSTSSSSAAAPAATCAPSARRSWD